MLNRRMAMKTPLTVVVALVTIVGCRNSKERIEDTYMVTAHTVVQLKPVYLGGQLQTGIPTMSGAAFGVGTME
jgi:outer membrane lipoprotein SlyB